MKIKNSFFISNSIFDYKLTPKAFYVFCYLKRCKNQQTGRCFPSHATIARACNISESSVARGLRELESKHLIAVENQFRDGKQLSNSYTFLAIAATNKTCNKLVAATPC